MIRHLLKKFNSYQVAIFLSTASLAFGILREFLIVGLLGFTAKNDILQLYLSIFYTIGLTIDAMRLACLNLYSVLSLRRILLCASIISLPFTIVIGLTMSYSTGMLNTHMLIITIMGSYLNLMASLLITYKQRQDYFLAAQIINVLPNFILIPGIFFCYRFNNSNMIYSIIYLTAIIPVAQCILLLLLRNRAKEVEQHNETSLLTGIMIFVRHFSVMVNEQFYQVIIRTAFYHYGAGYLSLFSIVIRIYSAARFILVDSFIGSRLANWHKNNREDDYFARILDLVLLSLFFVFISLIMSLQTSHHLIYSSIQISIILIFGFYFSTLVRIVYFKINRHQSNQKLVIRFAIIEFICLLAAILLTRQSQYPILTLLWMGYVAKPFCQLLLLRKYYRGLQSDLNYGTSSS